MNTSISNYIKDGTMERKAPPQQLNKWGMPILSSTEKTGGENNRGGGWLEMVRYNNNRGAGIIGRGCLEK